ncbi:MAG TPA: hypothetical protein VMH30_01280 [Verrucomicrobiae bacterium]|nr:hypothetical protein [Verrucomicrobiae bacterium]
MRFSARLIGYESFSIGHSGCHSENIIPAPQPGYGKGHVEMKATLEALRRQERKQRRRRRPAAGARRVGRVNGPPAATGIVSGAAMDRMTQTVERLAAILRKFKGRNRRK